MAIAEKDDRKISWFSRTISFRVLEEGVEESDATAQKTVADQENLANTYLIEALAQYLSKHAPEGESELQEILSTKPRGFDENLFRIVGDFLHEEASSPLYILLEPFLINQENPLVLLEAFERTYHQLIHLSLLLGLSQTYHLTKQGFSLSPVIKNTILDHFFGKEKGSRYGVLGNLLDFLKESRIDFYIPELASLGEALRTKEYQDSRNFFYEFETIHSTDTNEQNTSRSLEAEKHLAAVIPGLIYFNHYQWHSIRALKKTRKENRKISNYFELRRQSNIWMPIETQAHFPDNIIRLQDAETTYDSEQFLNLHPLIIDKATLDSLTDANQSEAPPLLYFFDGKDQKNKVYRYISFGSSQSLFLLEDSPKTSYPSLLNDLKEMEKAFD